MVTSPRVLRVASLRQPALSVLATGLLLLSGTPALSAAEEHRQEAAAVPNGAAPPRSEDAGPNEAGRRNAEKALAEKLAEEKIAARRQAEMEQAAERARLQQALERQCIIKPVMTDAEIATCKAVWR